MSVGLLCVIHGS